MGYTTEFSGRIKVDPPLDEREIAFLRKFAGTRRMDRAKGPYYVDGGGDFGQSAEADIRDYNRPPAGQPGLWCQWVPTEDGQHIEWDGGEKFYCAAEWMTYIIDHFLAPTAIAKGQLPFLRGHKCDGEIEAQGEESHDRWLLVVEDNKVSTRAGRVTYDTARPVRRVS